MFRLPFSFIITGLVSFILFQIFSLTDLASWIADQPRNPDGWFRTHLLILGWATMIAMGAVYQLINVVLQSQIYSEKLGFIQFAISLVGFIGILAGFLSMQVTWVAMFGTLTLIGFILFAWNIGMTLVQASKWNAITISTACAIAYLVFTGITGMLMGLNFKFATFSSFHEQLFGAHLWLGLLGWFGLLITGFTYQMLPMFYLSHNFPTTLQNVVLVLWNAGVIVGTLAFLFESPLWMKGIALLFITLAIAAFNVHISQIYKYRHKKNPGAGIAWSIFAARFLFVAAVATLVALILVPEQVNQAKTYTIIVWIYLWGWVAFTILSYLSKIVPFLWWTHKYGSQIGSKKTPSMSDLIADRRVNISLGAVTVSLFILLIGLGWEQSWMISTGGTALSVMSLVYISLIAFVFAK